MNIVNLELASLKFTVRACILAFASTLAGADQKIQDDLITVGSLCVGIDCVSDEAFGFNTLRLKENNVRIRFLDTSSSSSFPTNDWQITANESANGGLNKFSIDDIDHATSPFTIEASAPTASIYLDNSGLLGIGTSTPLVKLHLKASNTPTLRFDQDSSGGFTAQAWDIGGNETNFFVRDVTNGSKLPFRIIPAAPNDSLFIAADGDIGFGSSTPDGLFDIASAANANNHALLVSPTDYVGINIDNGFLPKDLFEVQTTGGVSRFVVQSDGNVGFGIYPATHPLHHGNGAHLTTGGVWTDASSRSLKDKITDLGLDVAIGALMALQPVTFSYKKQPGETYAGFIAEDVPEIVATNDRKGLAPMDIVAVLTKVVQAQQKLIDGLSSRLARLEAPIKTPNDH